MTWLLVVIVVSKFIFRALSLVKAVLFNYFLLYDQLLQPARHFCERDKFNVLIIHLFSHSLILMLLLMLLLLDLFFLIMQIKETKVLLRCEDRVQRMAIRDFFLQLADRAFFSVVVVVRIII